MRCLKNACKLQVCKFSLYLAIFALVCSTANLLQQAVILQTLQTAVDAAFHTIITIYAVDVVNGAWVRQATISQQRLYLF